MTDDRQAVLEYAGICKTFPGAQRTVVALDQVSFHVRPGEFVSLVGPSGCGKTTLLRITDGLETADRGTVSLDVLADAAPRQQVDVLEHVGHVL